MVFLIKKGFSFSVLIVLVVVASAAFVLLTTGWPEKPITWPPSPEPQPTLSTVTLSEGQRDGPFLAQKIYPDRVEGREYIEYPIGRDEGMPVTLRPGDSATDGCLVQLVLERIEGNKAVFTKYMKDPQTTMCPICLSGDTFIDAPEGSISVKDLKEGMIVYTQDENGQKVAVAVLKTGKTLVRNHKVVHLVLADGRELYASPGHPLLDGVLADLEEGDYYDGSVVVGAELVDYGEDYTYDLLPSGTSGIYWANGIPMRSTLR